MHRTSVASRSGERGRVPTDLRTRWQHPLGRTTGDSATSATPCGGHGPDADATSYSTIASVSGKFVGRACIRISAGQLRQNLRASRRPGLTPSRPWPNRAQRHRELAGCHPPALGEILKAGEPQRPVSRAPSSHVSCSMEIELQTRRSDLSTGQGLCALFLLYQLNLGHAA